MLVGKRRAEDLVVDPEVFAVDARLGNAGGAASFEDEDRLSRQPLGHPSLHRATAQPLVLEEIESLEVFVTLDVRSWVPIELGCVVKPEGTAGCRVEVPCHDLAH